MDGHICFLLLPQCNKTVQGKGSLPPQHGLELLTVYAWEQGGQNPQFNMAEGFRTVLELVGQYRQLCIYWTVNYDAEDKAIGDFLKLQLQKPRFGHPHAPLPQTHSIHFLPPYWQKMEGQDLLSGTGQLRVVLLVPEESVSQFLGHL